MTEHADAVHRRVLTLQARHRGCQHTVLHAPKATRLHLRPETGGTRPSRSHLVPLPLGGQVGQTAAGHRSELLAASLTVLIPPSFAEPGEEQAGRHGADRTRRGDSSRSVRQLTAGASSGRKKRRKGSFLLRKCFKEMEKTAAASVSSDLLPMDCLRCLSLLRLLRDLRMPLEKCWRVKLSVAVSGRL